VRATRAANTPEVADVLSGILGAHIFRSPAAPARVHLKAPTEAYAFIYTLKEKVAKRGTSGGSL
jgi:hypothetical protein